MSMRVSLLDRLRQSEYTGENRCIPCTLLNLLLAHLVALGVTAAVAAQTGTIIALGVGLGVYVLSLASIYLRGYLVPWTPALTRRFFPDRVLRLFGKDYRSAAASEAGIETADLIETDIVETVFRESGAVDPGDGTYRLTPSLRDAVHEEMRTIRDLEGDALHAEIGETFDMDEDGLSIVEEGDAGVIARPSGFGMDEEWPSRAALYADLAAGRVFADRFEGWKDMPLFERTEAFDAFRTLVATCPACDGEIVAEEGVVESCCGPVDVVAVSCRDCGDRLLEVEVDDV